MGQRLDQPWGHDGPAQPQGRRQGLADGAEGDDLVGCQPLQRADRVTVVAELRVVVVLQHHRIVVASPGEQRVPALRREHDAGGPLVSRGDDDGARSVAASAATSRPRSSTATGTTSLPDAGPRPGLSRSRRDPRSRRHPVGVRAAPGPGPAPSRCTRAPGPRSRRRRGPGAGTPPVSRAARVRRGGRRSRTPRSVRGDRPPGSPTPSRCGGRSQVRHPGHEVGHRGAPTAVDDASLSASPATTPATPSGPSYPSRCATAGSPRPRAARSTPARRRVRVRGRRRACATTGAGRRTPADPCGWLRGRPAPAAHAGVWRRRGRAEHQELRSARHTGTVSEMDPDLDHSVALTGGPHPA